jgi:hypothetical protein
LIACVREEWRPDPAGKRRGLPGFTFFGFTGYLLPWDQKAY